MRNYLNSSFFLAGILVFLLPFLEIKCNDKPLGHMTGFNLATKGEMTLSDPSIKEYIKDEQYKALRDQQQGPDPFSIIALVLLAAGIILQLALKKRRELFALIFAIAIVICLITMQILYQYSWDKRMEEAPDMMGYMKFTLHFGLGYWLALSISGLVILLNSWFIIQDKRSLHLKPYSEEDFPDNPEETSPFG